MSLVGVLNNKNLESFKINKTEIIELIQSGIEDQIDNRRKILEKEIKTLEGSLHSAMSPELYDEIIQYCEKFLTDPINNYIRAVNDLDLYRSSYKIKENDFKFEIPTYQYSIFVRFSPVNSLELEIPFKFKDKIKKEKEKQKIINDQIYDKKCELNSLNYAEKNLPKLVRKQRAMITREILEGESVGKELLEKIDAKVDELINLNKE